MIETKEELRYIMKFYGMREIRVINGGRCLGHITPNMEYKKSYTRSYRTGYEHLAFNDAINMLNADMADIEKYCKNKSTIYSTRLIYNGNEVTEAERDYMWKSDIEKCHLTCKKDNEGKLVLSGRMGDLSDFLQYANDHYKYCNGTYYTFDNEDVNKGKTLIQNYGLPNEYEWYHVGIVD